jgi:hypothetical protein
MTGRAGKTRNIWLVWLVWPILTLGIYHLVWYYKINREARDFDEKIAVEPTLSLLAVLIGWIIIVPPFVSIYRTGERIAQMQEDAGMDRSCNGWLGLVASFFFSLHALYYQYELNLIWARLGEPEEGSLVALPVSAGGPSTAPNGAAHPQAAGPQTPEPHDAEPQAPQPQDAQPQDVQPQAPQPQDAQPQDAQPQAARSGGVPGVRSDGTSARNGPADGDSSGMG